MIVLSYHRFNINESDYRFSRTFSQLYHDLRKKKYDEIHIDDARICTYQACEMAEQANVKLKIFVCTSLIGTNGYLTWDQLRELSMNHDIENHSHLHEWHDQKTYEWQYESIAKAQEIIAHEIGIAPSLFVAPYNAYNNDTDAIVDKLGLISRKGRENIMNFSK